MTNKQEKISQRDLNYVWLIIWAFLIMFLFSKSSPLYLFNDWVDANAFFTMGKGMARGLVPYRDLFEQKGPLLYFFHAIASVISRKTFFGVYLFEGLFMSVNLVCFYKIANFYFKPALSCLLSFVFPVFLLPDAYFHQGDSAEEFALAFFMLLLWGLFKSFQDQDNPLSFSWRFYLLQGFLVGCVLLIKYTLLGPWIAFYSFVFVFLLIKRRQECLRLIIPSAIGFLVATVPWLIYFWLHSALKTFIHVYFYINMFLYPSTDSNLFGKLFGIIYNLTTQYKALPVMSIIVLIGLGLTIYTSSLIKRKIDKAFFLYLYALTAFFVYYGGKTYSYYFLMMTPFALCGVLWIGKLLKEFVIVHGKQAGGKLHFGQICALGTVTICILSIYNANIQYSKLFPNNPTYAVESGAIRRPAQFVFADYIKKFDQPSLLNYRFLDAGFYLAADVLPTERYFELQNLAYELYPENLDAQQACIAEKRVDFVAMLTSVSVVYDQLDEPLLKKNYHLVARCVQERDGQPEAYWLFEKLP